MTEINLIWYKRYWRFEVYKCIVLVEKIGFDLCSHCYNTGLARDERACCEQCKISLPTPYRPPLSSRSHAWRTLKYVVHNLCTGNNLRMPPLVCLVGIWQPLININADTSQSKPVWNKILILEVPTSFVTKFFSRDVMFQKHVKAICNIGRVIFAYDSDWKVKGGGARGMLLSMTVIRIQNFTVS